MSNTDFTLPALLRHQATTRGDAPAFTFMDGAVLGTGHPESLTWTQLYRRVLSLAEELRRTATKGDRVAILAPQGLDYV
ncbi:MAG: AMP-binding protein, partial [Mycobacteriaceae bacterium]